MTDPVPPTPSNPAPGKLVEVDLPTGKVSLPEDIARVVIESRDKLKSEARSYAEKAGAYEQEKKAAAEALAKAEEDRRLAEAMKAGEIEKVREISNAKISTIATKYRDRALENIIAKAEGINPDFVVDVAQRVGMHFSYDLEADALVVKDQAGKPVIGSDGKPVDAQAYVSQFLTANQKYLLPRTPAGSGAAGGGNPGVAGAISADAFAKLSPSERSSFIGKGGKVS